MTRQPRGGGRALRRRLAGVPALVGVAFLLAVPLAAAPAAADSPMTVHIDSPSGAIADAGAVTVAGTVDGGLGPVVDTIHIQVVRSADGTSVLDTTLNPKKTGVNPFSATTPALTLNGAYKVTVTATGLLLVLPVEPATATATFKLAVPPAAPGNLKVTVQGDRSALVTWSAVPVYPDFVGYLVSRKTNSGAFQGIKGISDRTETSFIDSSLGSFSGPIQYQVAAIRGDKSDSSTWIVSTSDPAAATIPLPPTTVPGSTGPTTTVTPGGGLQPGGAASTDLGGFFSSQPAPIPVPPTSPPPTFPDTGYSETLPFGAVPTTADASDKVSGRSTGRPTDASGSGEVETQTLAGVNRRALLVPIAAGSVLCVAALHLRWLNRRLAIPVAAGGLGKADSGPRDLEVDVDAGAPPRGEDVFRPGRHPVGV